MLRWIIEHDGGAKFAFETLDEAKRWATENGFDTDTIRRLEPDEARAYSEMLRDTSMRRITEFEINEQVFVRAAMGRDDIAGAAPHGDVAGPRDRT